MKKYYISIHLCFFAMFFIPCLVYAAPIDSVRMDSVRSRLERVAALDPNYLTEIDLSIGKLPLAELLRNVAKVNGINLSVKIDDNRTVYCNFSKARITDLLYFLCREYNLDLDVIGNIISISVPPPVVEPPRIPKISTNEARSVLSYDLLDDKLVDVTKLIADKTGVNIIVPRQMYNQQVSGYAADLPVEEALYALASVNGFTMEKGDNGLWNIMMPENTQGFMPGAGNVRSGLNTPRRSFGREQIRVDSAGYITANVAKGNIHDLVLEVCENLRINRIFLGALDQEATIFVREVDLNTFLNVLFAGTTFTYQIENGVYIFGSAGQDKSLAMVKVIPLKYRTVEKVDELIPNTLKQGMQIQIFPDQNSIIASGTSRQVEQIERFLESIDHHVPLVTIEVMIVDVRKSVVQEMGVEAGLDYGKQTTSGSVSPGVNMNLSSSSINRLINSFNGFGSINLGKVTPSFYMNLKALEQAGDIEIRSTPKLSTLNGHEAKLKSGEDTYYKEVQNSYYGSQNPIQSESYVWKKVEANLSLTIVPFVSTNGKITLRIQIEQSEFTSRVENMEGPPGTTTRSFESIILVDNEEMVLLGGIDRNRKEKSSSGLPWIARVPILKWLTGTKKDNKSDERLNVFIKPTVIF